MSRLVIPRMCQILLNTEALRSARARWKSDHPKAIGYLESLPTSSIDVRRLITEYDQPVSAFRAWHRTRELEINATAVDEARMLRQQMATLKSELARYFADFSPND